MKSLKKFSGNYYEVFCLDYSSRLQLTLPPLRHVSLLRILLWTFWTALKSHFQNATAELCMLTNWAKEDCFVLFVPIAYDFMASIYKSAFVFIHQIHRDKNVLKLIANICLLLRQRDKLKNYYGFKIWPVCFTDHFLVLCLFIIINNKKWWIFQAYWQFC